MIYEYVVCREKRGVVEGGGEGNLIIFFYYVVLKSLFCGFIVVIFKGWGGERFEMKRYLVGGIFEGYFFLVNYMWSSSIF